MMMYKERLHCTEDTKIHVHQSVIGVKGSVHQFSQLSIKDYVESVLQSITKIFCAIFLKSLWYLLGYAKRFGKSSIHLAKAKPVKY